MKNELIKTEIALKKIKHNQSIFIRAIKDNKTVS